MTLNEDDIKRNVKDKDAWLRFADLAGFGLVFYITIPVVLVTAIFQFLARLLSGASFPGVSEFGGNVAQYLLQVTRYLTFASNERPFPFAPFPSHTITTAEVIPPTNVP